MKNTVVFSADFAIDLEQQTQYLLDADRVDWAERLMSEIEALVEALAQHPELGVLEMPEGIRRAVLPRLPFLVRYYWAKPDEKIVVLRLFHARQKR